MADLGTLPVTSRSVLGARRAGSYLKGAEMARYRSWDGPVLGPLLGLWWLLFYVACAVAFVMGGLR